MSLIHDHASLAICSSTVWVSEHVSRKLSKNYSSSTCSWERREILDMRWLLSLFVLALLSLVQALSSSGNRLLVVIEEAAEKSKYSKFWTDLEGGTPWSM